MVSLVDDECVLGNIGGLKLVGAEEPDELGLGLGNLGRGRDESDLEGTGTGRGTLKDIVAVPLLGQEVGGVLVHEASNHLVEGLSIHVVGDSRTNDNHGVLRGLELLAERTSQRLLQSSQVRAEMLKLKCRLPGLADHTDLKVGPEPLFPDAGVQNGSLVARVGANKQDGVRGFNSEDLGVEEIVGADVNAVGNRLATSRHIQGQILGTKLVGKILHRDQRLNLGELSGNDLELVTLHFQATVGSTNLSQSLLPRSRFELAFPSN